MNNKALSVLMSKRTMKSAMDCSEDGDVIYAASGNYDRICAQNRSITIIGTNGPELSFRDSAYV